MIDPGERRLVELAQSGNQDAFTELFLQNRSRVIAVGCEIFRGPGSEQDVEDFCGDVWMLALKYLSSFRGECRFGTWLVRVARHRAIAIVQRRAQPKNGDSQLVYRGYDESADQWERQFSAVEDSRLEAATAGSDVARLVQSLRPEHRELVQLYHLDGLTESEIASRKGLSAPAVRGRLWRAMVQSRKKVEKGANRNALKISLTIQKSIFQEGDQ